MFSGRRRHTRSKRDWSSDVCSSDLIPGITSQVATFQIIEGIGLFNTIWSVILLNLGTDVISIYVFLQYLDEIPVSLDESAFLDRSEERRVGKVCRCSALLAHGVVYV